MTEEEGSVARDEVPAAGPRDEVPAAGPRDATRGGVNFAALPRKRGREGPLSIVELLKKAGIDIARRTVAKYREQLGIL